MFNKVRNKPLSGVWKWRKYWTLIFLHLTIIYVNLATNWLPHTNPVLHSYPTRNYLFKVIIRNTRTSCKIVSDVEQVLTSSRYWLACFQPPIICWNSTMETKTPERRHSTDFTYCSRVSIVDFEEANVGWVLKTIDWFAVQINNANQLTDFKMILTLFDVT